ncbi:hypothetical protein PR202_gb09547 [Eleusine coracana subsp. coracana]|uniref:Uncharacterized protein n=1 Tax=Eleusine coracana subsp. coracana TaxID=191504 RepID=A0AAV5EF83_ELECO|nr:hypothetical protein PR202_gb09547 [Eleusine coracana subsp. coracana]
MGSLNNTQESYVRLATSRRWRRGGARGFRLCEPERAELLFLGLVGRYARLLARRLSKCGGAGNSSSSSCGRSGSRRVLVVGAGKDAAAPCKNYTRPPPASSSFARTNSFYSQAIADCLEFIKRNSVPVEDYGSVSDRR